MSKIPLNEFITLQRGFDLPSNKRISGSVPVVASTGIAGYHNEIKVKAPGVVIGRSGSIGGGQYIEKDFFPLNTTLYVKDFKGHYPRFIYYLLKSIDFTSFNVGTGVPTLNRNHLSSILISDLGIDKEKEIANILGNLDQKIQLNTQINQTLEQIVQALFKSWFIDFDPVRAKVQALSDGLSLEQAELAAMQAISGKTPEELTALSQTQPDRYAELAETAKAFPCEMVEVDGVEVPKGWEMKALSDLGQIICGKTPSKSNKEYYGNEVPFIKIPDMHNQAFITQTTDNLSLSGANSQSKKYIPPKSICVSCIATVGLVSMTSKPSHTNQQINSIIPNDEQTSEFLYLSLKQSSMTKYLKDLASGGSATLNLNTSTFSKIEIITPLKIRSYLK